MFGNIIRNVCMKKLKSCTIVTSSYSTRCCPTFAVVLSGCGINDGTEIHEAAAVFSHLSRNNAAVHYFAPNVAQMDVVNHLETVKICSHTRNSMIESARITRGHLSSLSELAKMTCLYDAVIFPGGFGVSKNLSNFATHGIECTVIPDVVTILQDFHKCRKPIGFSSIASILAARVLTRVTITLGKDSCEEHKWPYRDVIKAAIHMGAKVENREVNEVTFDKNNMIFSTPAFLYVAGQYHEIDDAIGNMIQAMLEVLKNSEHMKSCI